MKASFDKHALLKGGQTAARLRCCTANHAVLASVVNATPGKQEQKTTKATTKNDEVELFGYTSSTPSGNNQTKTIAQNTALIDLTRESFTPWYDCWVPSILAPQIPKPPYRSDSTAEKALLSMNTTVLYAGFQASGWQTSTVIETKQKALARLSSPTRKTMGLIQYPEYILYY